MKPCLICHHENDDAAPTCPRCGEASWGACVGSAPKRDAAPVTALDMSSPSAADDAASANSPADGDASASPDAHTASAADAPKRNKRGRK